jgi:hypothetical protein
LFRAGIAVVGDNVPVSIGAAFGRQRAQVIGALVLVIGYAIEVSVVGHGTAVIIDQASLIRAGILAISDSISIGVRAAGGGR